MKIKAILFDSGMVLTKPASGHWMITLNFFEYVNKKGFYSFTKKQREKAFALAMKHVRNDLTLKNQEEEVKLFTKYYQMFFETLGMMIPKDNYELIAKDMVYTFGKFSFYEDAKDVIPRLSKLYDLGVVSDAYTSLNQVYEEVDYKKYFKTFMVSSEVGCLKPEKEIYMKAITSLLLEPEACAYIDDKLINCDGAKAVGIKTRFLLCRSYISYLYFKIKCKDHIVLRNLYELEKHLEKIS